MKTHGIMYHHFHDDLIHIKGQGSISAEEFEEMLDYYQRDHRVIPAQEYYDKALKGKLNENEVCITFDDALRCQYDIAYPVLQKKGLTAFWFVYTSPMAGVVEKLEIYRHFRFLKFADIDEFYSEFFKIASGREKELNCSVQKALNDFNPEEYAKAFSFYTPNDKRFRYVRDVVLGVEKYNLIMDTMLAEHCYNVEKNSSLLWMTGENIQDLHESGHIIGLHSHTHPTVMSNLDYSGQKSEYSQNKAIIESILKDNVTTVSYPCNSYNSDTLAIMQDLGIVLGFRANMENGFNTMYEFPREDHANILRRMKNENNHIHK